jgi:hypothetical protein
MQGVYIDTRLFLCHTLKATLKKVIHAKNACMYLVILKRRYYKWHNILKS